jgi:hypothetical protein
MLDTTELFVDGERQLGYYTIEIIRRVGNGWNPTVPPLHAVVSNYRLILKPQVRKAYTPASIPSNYFSNVNSIEIGRHKGIQVSLSTGHDLYIMVSQRDSENMVDDIRTMLEPAPDFHFDDKIAQADIKRLIDFFNKAPTHPLD